MQCESYLKNQTFLTVNIATHAHPSFHHGPGSEGQAFPRPVFVPQCRLGQDRLLAYPASARPVLGSQEQLTALPLVLDTVLEEEFTGLLRQLNKENLSLMI